MSSRPTAVITGASRGIGRAIALRLAPDYHVIAAARSAEELHSLAREIAEGGGECTPCVVDVSDEQGVASALRGVAADVLVNNAGVGVLRPMLELTPTQWRAMVDVNFNALYYVTRVLLPGMLDRGRGHIVNIGSISGRSAFVGGACYAATKHAVMAFSECLMLEVRDRGLKVSVVNPGSVATSFGDNWAGGKPWALRPEDVAASVAHVLATPPNVLLHRVEVRTLSPKKS
ncbi:MAG TPA: SDR family oxidoreductase [Gemmatimonadaceae bacterium]|nr:SDR family oxidoreductase [Gemmatimonadaceae bacterium]